MSDGSRPSSRDGWREELRVSGEDDPSRDDQEADGEDHERIGLESI
jgi:hypothetical protein